MKVLYIRTNNYSFDSRVAKELTTMMGIDFLDITCFGWNRNGLGSKEVEKTTITINGKQLPAYLVDIYGPWGRGPRKNFLPLFKYMKALKKWLKKNIEKYDAIHCVDLGTAHVAIPIAKKHNKKIVYDIFDYFPDIRRYPKIVRSYFIRAENRAIKKADVTIICSEARIKQIGKAKYKKIEVIHNSPNINANDFASVNNEIITFSYVGNLVQDRLIDVILHFFSKHQEYRLNIAGVGQLSDLAKKYSDEFDNIYFYGPLKYEDVLELQNKSDILFALYEPSVPNHKYVAANKFYEALALGKQIIMCKGTGMDSEILSNNLGVVIDPNIESLEVNIKKLVDNRAMWKEYGNKEKQIFESQYSWKIMSQRIVKIYDYINQLD